MYYEDAAELVWKNSRHLKQLGYAYLTQPNREDFRSKSDYMHAADLFNKASGQHVAMKRPSRWDYNNAAEFDAAITRWLFIMSPVKKVQPNKFYGMQQFDNWSTAANEFQRAAEWPIKQHVFYILPQLYRKRKGSWEPLPQKQRLESLRSWRNFVFNVYVVYKEQRDTVRIELTGYSSRAKFPTASFDMGKTTYREVERILINTQLRWDLSAGFLDWWWKQRMEQHLKMIVLLMPHPDYNAAFQRHGISPSSIPNEAAQIYREAFLMYCREARNWKQLKHLLIGIDENPKQFVSIIGGQRFTWWVMRRLQLEMVDGELRRKKATSLEASRKGIRFFQHYVIAAAPDDSIVTSKVAAEKYMLMLQQLQGKIKPIDYKLLEEFGETNAADDSFEIAAGDWDEKTGEYSSTMRVKKRNASIAKTQPQDYKGYGYAAHPESRYAEQTNIKLQWMSDGERAAYEEQQFANQIAAEKEKLEAARELHMNSTEKRVKAAFDNFTEYFGDFD